MTALRGEAVCAILMSIECEAQSKTQCPKSRFFFLQKGEPKQTRIDVRLLTSVAPQTDAAQEGRVSEVGLSVVAGEWQ